MAKFKPYGFFLDRLDGTGMVKDYQTLASAIERFEAFKSSPETASIMVKEFDEKGELVQVHRDWARPI